MMTMACPSKILNPAWGCRFGIRSRLVSLTSSPSSQQLPEVGRFPEVQPPDRHALRKGARHLKRARGPHPFHHERKARHQLGNPPRARQLLEEVLAVLHEAIDSRNPIRLVGAGRLAVEPAERYGAGLESVASRAHQDEVVP